MGRQRDPGARLLRLVGQVLAFHVNWLRERGYARAILYLPHDGVNREHVTGKRYEDHLREAGFAVEPPVRNQGKGAAMMRIEALRRLGPSSGSTRRPPSPAATPRLLPRAQGRHPQCRPRAGARLVQPRRRRAGADGGLLRAAGRRGASTGRSGTSSRGGGENGLIPRKKSLRSVLYKTYSDGYELSVRHDYNLYLKDAIPEFERE